MKKYWSVLVKIKWLLGAVLFLSAGYALADAITIGNIAENITNSFQQIGKLMAATSYLSGFGFAIAAIFKFKQHKDNPTQIPMGTPIALLGVGVVLIFLPGIIKPTGFTIFGSGADLNSTAGGFKGKGAESMPGGNQ